MITCLFTVFNEEDRIATALKGALAWADEVLVLDKSSTDNTAAIARELGAKVVQVPYTMQGDDDAARYASFAANDWIVALTPSEQLTPAMVTKIRETIPRLPDTTDLVQVPVKMYTFGDFVSRSNGPWSISYQTRIVNRRHAKHVRKVHVHWEITKNTVRIPFEDDAYFIHCTHPDFDKFVVSHIQYAKIEAMEAKDPIARAREALAKAHVHDLQFQMDGEIGARQHIAWKMYHYMIALACLDSATGRDVRSEYKALLKSYADRLTLR